MSKHDGGDQKRGDFVKTPEFISDAQRVADETQSEVLGIVEPLLKEYRLTIGQMRDLEKELEEVKARIKTAKENLDAVNNKDGGSMLRDKPLALRYQVELDTAIDTQDTLERVLDQDAANLLKIKETLLRLKNTHEMAEDLKIKIDQAVKVMRICLEELNTAKEGAH